VEGSLTIFSMVWRVEFVRERELGCAWILHTPCCGDREEAGRADYNYVPKRLVGKKQYPSREAFEVYDRRAHSIRILAGEKLSKRDEIGQSIARGRRLCGWCREGLQDGVRG
jgi:hypothetical protein